MSCFPCFSCQRRASKRSNEKRKGAVPPSNPHQDPSPQPRSNSCTQHPCNGKFHYHFNFYIRNEKILFPLLWISLTKIACFVMYLIQMLPIIFQDQCRCNWYYDYYHQIKFIHVAIM